MNFSSDAYQTMNAVIERLEQNQRLALAENFVERTQALDVLELFMLDEDDPAADNALFARAKALKQALDSANEQLFARLLDHIHAHDRAAVSAYFHDTARQLSSDDDDEVGYDELDMLLNGLLDVGLVPAEPKALAAEMVFYQPTPARIALKLIDELQPVPEDVFYDLGSGLGHVPILVNLLAGSRTKGVELEAAYIRHADETLKKLGLSDVTFIHADAREVDYSDGTIFYLYTPFQGEILRQALALLEAQAGRRPIHVCTYGPCTAQVSQQGWLESLYQQGEPEVRLGIFRSY
jgi:hypothetical protein